MLWLVTGLQCATPASCTTSQSCCSKGEVHLLTSSPMDIRESEQAGSTLPGSSHDLASSSPHARSYLPCMLRDACNVCERVTRPGIASTPVAYPGDVAAVGLWHASAPAANHHHAGHAQQEMQDTSLDDTTALSSCRYSPSQSACQSVAACQESRMHSAFQT